ncbi:MAG TPA: hypothetical protein VJ011_08455 [Steroidobacteraceae bacterium]|nr:hypothetical protein [Steroidobacteraceae bacterium]
MSSVLVSPSGALIQVMGRQGQLRQNPNAAQVVLAGAALIVLSSPLIQLERGQGVLAFGSASGASAGAAGVLTAAIQATVPPALPVVLQAASDDAGAGASARPRMLMAAFIPANVNVPSQVQIDLTVAAAAQNFDVGAQPLGGCSLLWQVVELQDLSFTLITASP